MASLSPSTRRTRSSSVTPQVTPKQSPRSIRSSNTGGLCGAKRRVFYPEENPSPAKKMRSSTELIKDEEEVNVKAKTFYGRGRGTYINPLDRKKLGDKRRQKMLENKDVTDVMKALPKVQVKHQKKGKGKAKVKESLQVDDARRKPPLQEIEHLAFSPMRNKVKVETRVYSPSRKGQKFFKSRRATSNANKTTTIVQKNRGLKVTYQPKGITSKSKDRAEMPSFLLNSKFVSPSLPKRDVMNDAKPKTPGTSTLLKDSTARIRRSPVKTPVPKPVRMVISSSKNPNSPDLFSPSDWDFGDDGDAFSTNPSAESPEDSLSITTITCVEYSEESKQPDSNTPTVDTCSVNLLTEPSEGSSRCTSPGSVDSENREPSEELPEAKPKKVFDIFTTTKSRALSESGSNRSSPLDGKRRLNLRDSRSTKRLKSLRDKDGKEQMTLDFGQTLKGAVHCESCGMTYNHGEPSDETMHKRFHERILSILRFPGWKKENILQEFADGSRIIVVMPDEKMPMKKVLAVKKVVDDELGFVVDSSFIQSTSKTFMYISEEKHIAGFCVAEKISEAYRALADEQSPSPNDSKTVKPWCCSTKPEKVRCGINRIWVLGSERRRNIASKLIDCVRANFLLGFPLRKIDLAFTDPTPDGRAFATKYIGTPSFLVYKH